MIAAGESKHADPSRRLLVVAFYYPPDNSSTGVLRTLKFTQYLDRYGWASDVLTVPERLYPSRDPSLLSSVPSHVRVHRPWAMDIRRTLSIRGVYPGWLAFPDRYWPWLIPAVRRSASLIREEGIDALYTTFPIPTAHMIGLRLKRRFGLPWLADFRDPWVESSIPPLRRKAEGYLERRVVENADRVICNTPAMRRFYLERYPGLSETKFVTITNGYDESDFAGLVGKRSNRFEIVYPGLIDADNRNPEPLLAGVRRALDDGLLNGGDLKLTFLGCGSYGDSRAFMEQLERFRLDAFVERAVERVPYREALGRLAGASLLVVLSETVTGTARARAVQEYTRLQVPAKVYEYLRLGRPMLVLVSEGAVAELLRETWDGRPIAPSDVSAIATALGKAYDRHRSGSATVNPEPSAAVRRYSRENLTGLLAAELAEVCDRAPEGTHRTPSASSPRARA